MGTIILGIDEYIVPCFHSACILVQYSVRQWLDSRPLIQKQFVDVMVRTLARKAQPTECQVCECLADEAQVGISQCRSCFRRDPFFWVSKYLHCFH